MKTLFEIENAVKSLSSDDLTSFRDWFRTFDAATLSNQAEEETYPVLESADTLEELIANITDENRHGEINSGPPVGNEVWE